MPHLIQNSCTKCGACLVECPTGSIIEGADQFYIDADTCADHAACVAVCPVEAIVPQPSPRRKDDEEE
jgi:ferredoxin